MQRIAIHSVPRSGSTWLGSIFDSHPKVIYKYQPLFSYAFKDQLSLTSSKDEIVEFFEEISKSNDDFLNQTEGKRKNLIPDFEKSEPQAIAYKEVRYHQIIPNLLKKDPDIKVIGLIRNPISTIYSWYNAPREFRRDLGWDIHEEWKYAHSKNQNKVEEYNGYEKWKEVAILFTKLEQKYPSKFYLVSYLDLLKNTESVVTELFSFIGLEVPSQTINYITQSTSISDKDAYSVYKNKNSDQKWKDNFHPSIIKSIEQDLTGTILEKYLDSM